MWAQHVGNHALVEMMSDDDDDDDCSMFCLSGFWSLLEYVAITARRCGGPISIHILAHVQYAQTYICYSPAMDIHSPTATSQRFNPAFAAMTVDRDQHVAMAAMANGGDDMYRLSKRITRKLRHQGVAVLKGTGEAGRLRPETRKGGERSSTKPGVSEWCFF